MNLENAPAADKYTLLLPPFSLFLFLVVVLSLTSIKRPTTADASAEFTSSFPRLSAILRDISCHLRMHSCSSCEPLSHSGSKQYKVAEGDVIKVEKLAAEAGSEVTFDDVILVSTDSDVKCGDAVANASVTASVVGEGKSKKVIVYKYKRKTGYHKKNGHRQAFTQVKIEKINA